MSTHTLRPRQSFWCRIWDSLVSISSMASAKSAASIVRALARCWTASRVVLMAAVLLVLMRIVLSFLSVSLTFNYIIVAAGYNVKEKIAPEPLRGRGGGPGRCRSRKGTRKSGRIDGKGGG